MKLKKRMDSLDIYGKDSDVRIAINKELLSGQLKPKGQLRGGMEFSLAFTNVKKQQSFEKEVNWRQCYIYLFKGHFKNQKINFECAEGNSFIVEDYKLIPQYPNCVMEKDKEQMEQLENMENSYEPKIHYPVTQ
ncbi:hypothetical protein YA38_06340 [Klebsiella aerogenes]|nr:hypothetical protein YA38_06340 [Klebsiella aerogenes]